MGQNMYSSVKKTLILKGWQPIRRIHCSLQGLITGKVNLGAGRRENQGDP
jgi:hypothetical protein